MSSVEEKYRKEAKAMLSQINQARKLFHLHKPSIGYIGEYILRKSLKRVLPNGLGICQGFVLNNTNSYGKLSRQCDIIIFRKEKGAIAYSVGDIKVINSCSAIAVIEIKSSVSKKTFLTTLDAFNRLKEFGVKYKFVFVFNKFTKDSLYGWFSQYRFPDTNRTVLDTDLYDWSDKEWLPKSILSLASCKYYMLGHLQDDKDDWVGYAAYKITDKTCEEISCLQEFFATITEMLKGSFVMEQEEYSVKDGFPLFRM